MNSRSQIAEEILTHFEAKWQKGDPWDLESSSFEKAKYLRQLDALGERHYGRALEIGCGNGIFTRLLAARADRIVAFDIAPSAVEMAIAAGDADGRIDFRVANAMEFDARAEGPWDLIVLSETLPYIGWLYPLFDVAWFASELFGSVAPGGQLLMANTFAGVSDYLLRPWLIHTYRDLFRNVGFTLERETVFQGSKDGVEIESLICVFRKESLET